MSLFGKFLSNYVALIISTFSTVAFIVVTTRQVFYNATADEPIGLLGTLGLLSQEVFFFALFLLYFVSFPFLSSCLPSLSS